MVAVIEAIIRLKDRTAAGPPIKESKSYLLARRDPDMHPVYLTHTYMEIKIP